MTLPLKLSVAVAIRQADRILVVQRANDDEEFPGIWGLPAGSYQTSESLEHLVARIGRDKLSVDLRPIRKLAAGSQDRKSYHIDMELWETSMIGVPQHPHWKWANPRILAAGKDAGSLCCHLALEISQSRTED